jgi:3-deoxy-D-manno-octulosonate 8-phosphate phosphatase (KDO 8-P phosphatase)
MATTRGAPGAAEAAARAARIRVVAMDVDGTLTDGAIMIGDGGELFKRFSVRDGLGLRLLVDAGIELAIVTGRESRIVVQRAAELGISRVHQGVSDKAGVLEWLCRDLGVDVSRAAFVGDDWPDLAAMRICGFAAAPADAEPSVLACAHWVAPRSGGKGAIRDIAEFILRAQGLLEPP